MTKILIVDLARYYGGADVRVLSLARAFEQANIPYSIASLEGSDLHRRLELEGLSMTSVPLSRGDARNVSFLRNVISKGGFTIVDAHNPQSQLWAHTASIGIDGIRRVSTMHSSYRFEHGSSLKGHAYEQVIRINAGLGCDFIAVSEAVDSYLIDTVGLDRKRVQLIPNGILIPDTIGNPTHELIDSLGWGQRTVVVVVGRLEEVKGHTYLIEAMKQIAPEFPQLRCLFIGEGRSKESLQAQVIASGLADVVYFAGFRDDVEQILPACDIFCLPSLSEGLPYALLEASARKVPALVSKVGGMAKLLTHGENATFAEPADPKTLALGLRWLMENPDKAQQQAEAAYDLVQREYSFKTMLERTLALYKQ